MTGWALLAVVLLAAVAAYRHIPREELMFGVLIGLVLSVLLAGWFGLLPWSAAGATKPDPMNGVTITCKGNGPGGYRTCDVNVETPGPVRRMDYSVYIDGQWFVDMNVSGINPGHGPNMVESPLRVEVNR